MTMLHLQRGLPLSPNYMAFPGSSVVPFIIMIITVGMNSSFAPPFKFNAIFCATAEIGFNFDVAEGVFAVCLLFFLLMFSAAGGCYFFVVTAEGNKRY